MSQSYYTCLEQGLSLNASAEVLDAMANALRLDRTERQHRRDLAGAACGGTVLAAPKGHIRTTR